MGHNFMNTSLEVETKSDEFHEKVDNLEETKTEAKDTDDKNHVASKSLQILSVSNDNSVSLDTLETLSSSDVEISQTTNLLDSELESSELKKNSNHAEVLPPVSNSSELNEDDAIQGLSTNNETAARTHNFMNTSLEVQTKSDEFHEKVDNLEETKTEAKDTDDNNHVASKSLQNLSVSNDNSVSLDTLETLSSSDVEISQTANLL